MRTTTPETRAARRLVRPLAALLTLAAATPLLAQDPGARASGDKPGLAVGAPMADFGLRALDFQSGKLQRMVWLSDFVGDTPKTPKRLLLLNFFATWCKPCMREVPKLATWQREFGPQGLQVVSVNFRRGDESWQDAVAATLKRLGPAAPPYPVVFDKYTGRNQALYMGSRGTLPCNILLDAQGRVLARFQGGAERELAALHARIVDALGAEHE